MPIVAEDAKAFEGADHEAMLLERSHIDGRPGGVFGFEVANVHDGKVLGEHAVREAALGQPAVHRAGAADEDGARQTGPGGGVLAFVPAAGGLAVPAADTAADALLQFALLQAFG